ncbi:unnamed protein product [Thlaspi arvense]|uniref:Uncharacterized protein n=1 Tax=Thlaspi arvense TaxID=13288 RepID=A0AAU9S562_THLAR|nr:unnamed protein product [Thlaspi arvense]
MGRSKFLLLMALFFTCVSLANSARPPFRANPGNKLNAKEPEQYDYGGGYVTGPCRYGCCYRGGKNCIGCCRHLNTNRVGMQKRSRGQVTEEASPVWAQSRP